jgi:beta-lactam-binding protein with PASTA domain
VPSLLGQSVESAKGILTPKDLVLGATTTKRTREASPGQVIEQSPAPGTRVARGSAVSLVLAEAPRRVVPDVMAKDLDTARSVLSRAGFSVRSVSNEETEQAPPNTVLRVEPAAGTEVADESPSVELVVAIAPDRRVSVPPLIGLPLDDATERLKRAGLVANSRRGRRDATLPDLQVTAQEPAAGTRLAKGDTVTLDVNPRPTPPKRLQPERVQILYPGEQARPAADCLASSLQKLGWPVSVKADTAREPQVEYYVESDADLALMVVKYAEACKLPSGSLPPKLVPGSKGGYITAWMPAAQPPKSSGLRATVFYGNDDARPHAEGLADYFRSLGLQAVSKEGGSRDKPGARVEYFVERDAKAAEGLAARASEWFRKRRLRVTFTARLVQPQPNTVAEGGGYFVVWTPAAAR